MRCGTVAIVGRTNVGKSTFLNACLGEKIAIVSPLPQTTRDELLGVVHRPGLEIAFSDTPGFHRPKSELGRRMNQTALDSVRSSDAVVFITDVAKLGSLAKKQWRPDSDPIHADDRRLLTMLPRETPALLVLNKVDLLRDKSRLLPLIAAFNEAHSFRSTIPSSVLHGDGVDRILDELGALLPEGEARYAPDDMTDRPATFFVREFVREQIMLGTEREVPHAVAVTVERFEEGKIPRIQATIHVEKPGQRVILVGHRGERVKAIGSAARAQLETLLGKQIHLELFIRVTERWKDVPRQLSELGYTEGGGGRGLTSLLPESKSRTSRPRPARAGKSAQLGTRKPGERTGRSLGGGKKKTHASRDASPRTHASGGTSAQQRTARVASSRFDNARASGGEQANTGQARSGQGLNQEQGQGAQRAAKNAGRAAKVAGRGASGGQRGASGGQRGASGGQRAKLGRAGQAGAGKKRATKKRGARSGAASRRGSRQ